MLSLHRAPAAEWIFSTPSGQTTHLSFLQQSPLVALMLAGVPFNRAGITQGTKTESNADHSSHHLRDNGRQVRQNPLHSRSQRAIILPKSQPEIGFNFHSSQLQWITSFYSTNLDVLASGVAISADQSPSFPTLLLKKTTWEMWPSHLGVGTHNLQSLRVKVRVGTDSRPQGHWAGV